MSICLRGCALPLALLILLWPNIPRQWYGVADEDKAYLDIDVLADRENYKWVPAISSYLDTDMDFRRLDLKYAFHNVSDTVVNGKKYLGLFVSYRV